MGRLLRSSAFLGPSTRQLIAWMCLINLLTAFAGCNDPEEGFALVPKKKNYNAPLPPGQLALVKLTDPATFPDFSEGYNRRAGLEQAARYSLDYMNRPSSRQFFPYGDVSHERAVASLNAFIEVLRSAQSGEDLDAKLKERFDIYQSRGCDDLGTVLYTGYYRPIFDGRLQPDGEFKYPLYKRPPDLEFNPQTMRCQRKGGGPYLSRAEIEGGALAGQNLELCYLRDRFETYIVTVQGSGRLRLADGSYFDIGYHGDNGRQYSSIGQHMVDQGMIEPEQLSLQGLIRYFKENPDRINQVLATNERYVFFTQRGGGPYGSLNVPVTPFRSIATDKEVYPRASVAYLQTLVPARGEDGQIRNHSYRGFAMDQDTGGAIRAAGRCDFFLGTGPEVGELAGRTFAEGKLYYIFVKDGSSAPMVPQGQSSMGNTQDSMSEMSITH